MSVLFMEGWEAGLQTVRWDYNLGGTIPSSSYGRLGGIGVRLGDLYSDVIGKTITLADDTYAYSFAVRPYDIGDIDTVIQNAFGSGKHIVWQTGDQIGVRSSPGHYVSTAGTFTKNAWHWVEAEIFFHASTGTVKVWVDGSLVIDESGLNTGSRPTTIRGDLGGTQTSHIRAGYYDDYIISDGAGSYNNTRPLGDSRVLGLFPDGDGNVSGLTGSDTNQIDNYLQVDENPEPNTSDYNASSTEGDKDLYALDDLPNTTGSILAIQVEHYAAKDDSGSKFGRSVIRTNSTDYPQTSVGLTVSPTYQNDERILEENPNTTSAWTPSEINSLEAGFEVRDS